MFTKAEQQKLELIYKVVQSCIPFRFHRWYKPFNNEMLTAGKDWVRMNAGMICRKSYNVGSEVFTVVVMKSTIFWDITLCRLLKVNQHSQNISPPSLELAYSTLKMKAICSYSSTVTMFGNLSQLM
jgi:hypothetical protein